MHMRRWTLRACASSPASQAFTRVNRHLARPRCAWECLTCKCRCVQVCACGSLCVPSLGAGHRQGSSGSQSADRNPWSLPGGPVHQDTNVQEQRLGLQPEKGVRVGRGRSGGLLARQWEQCPRAGLGGTWDLTGRGQPGVPDRLHSPGHSKTRRPPGPSWLCLGLPPAQKEQVLVVSTGDQRAFSQMHSIRNLPSTRFLEQQREDGVEDMTQLE